MLKARSEMFTVVWMRALYLPRKDTQMAMAKSERAARITGAFPITKNIVVYIKMEHLWNMDEK